MEGLGVFGIGEQFLHSFACLLRVACSKVCFPATAFRVAKKVEVIMVHLFRVWRCWCSIFVLAVSVALPCLAEGGAVFSGDEGFKGNDGGGVSLVVSSSQVVHERQVPNVAVFNGHKIGDERLSELRGGGDKAGSSFTSAAPFVDKQSDQQGAKNSDASGDDWYWYVQFPFSTLLLLWVAGCFRGAGALDVGHKTPNV